MSTPDLLMYRCSMTTTLQPTSHSHRTLFLLVGTRLYTVQSLWMTMHAITNMHSAFLSSLLQYKARLGHVIEVCQSFLMTMQDMSPLSRISCHGRQQLCMEQFPRMHHMPASLWQCMHLPMTTPSTLAMPFMISFMQSSISCRLSSSTPQTFSCCLPSTRSALHCIPTCAHFHGLQARAHNQHTIPDDVSAA